MVKNDQNILSLAVVACLFFWIADSLVGYFFLYDRSFLDVLFFHKEAIASRLIFMVCFLIFGKIIAGLFSEQKNAEAVLKSEIIERKHGEEELLKVQKLESIGILAGGVAHDFNNLFQSIMGNISLAKMDLNPEDRIYKMLTEAESACQEAQELNYRLLTFAKSEKPLKKTVFIRALLKDAVRFSLSGSNITPEFDIADDLYPVDIDKGQIIQSINNLVSHAKETMPGGGVLKVYARNVTVSDDERLPLKAGDYLKLSIEDQGIGIPEEYLSRLFDFSNINLESLKSGRLGILVCYYIIEKHGGHIMVESEEGIGTTFHFYLPRSKNRMIENEELETDGVENESVITDQMEERGRVLVMDDEDNIRDIAGEMLQYLKYEVEYARDGEEAIELFREEKERGKSFDAVILDLTVSRGMGGVKAMKRLLEIDPEAKGIVSSGYSNDPMMTEYKANGFKAALAKPYGVRQLRKVLKKVMT